MIKKVKKLSIGIILSGLVFLGITTHAMAANFNVDMGDMTAPCGGAGTTDIGFVDCDTTMTGGILVTAMTNVSVGDSVTWTMRSTPHTTSSGTQPTPGACATGDNWDSTVGNAFTPGFVFTHTFNNGTGNCAYFCIIHPSTMTGQVNVSGAPTTTTTPVTTTTVTLPVTTTTVTLPVTTTTVTVPVTTTTLVTPTTTRPATTTTAVATTTTRPGATTTTSISATTTTVKEGKVEICHKGKNTLSISNNAVPAHLAHGDTLGACS